MTRREFTGRIAARIVWTGLILEAVYFFWLASRLAAAARSVPGWQPDAHEPASVLYTALFGVVLLFLGAVYFMRMLKTRGWLHFLSPVFLVFGLFELATAGGLTEYIYGEWKTIPSAITALSGFGFMLIGVFAIIARMFVPREVTQAEGLFPTAPTDRPEP